MIVKNTLSKLPQAFLALWLAVPALEASACKVRFNPSTESFFGKYVYTPPASVMAIKFKRCSWLEIQAMLGPDFANVRDLDLSHNLLRGNEPRDLRLGVFKQLRRVNLSHNYLSTDESGMWQTPWTISFLDDTHENFESLDLSYNLFTTIPNRLDELASLKNLDLSYNRLTTLKDMGRRLRGSLDSLKSLNLSHNQLQRLSHEIGRMKLESLDVSGNPLTSVPRACLAIPHFIYAATAITGSELPTIEGYEWVEKDQSPEGRKDLLLTMTRIMTRGDRAYERESLRPLAVTQKRFGEDWIWVSEEIWTAAEWREKAALPDYHIYRPLGHDLNDRYIRWSF